MQSGVKLAADATLVFSNLIMVNFNIKRRFNMRKKYVALAVIVFLIGISALGGCNFRSDSVAVVNEKIPALMKMIWIKRK